MAKTKVRCTVTNSTRDATYFVFPYDWHGQVDDDEYPETIPSGDSGQFRHVSDGTGKSESAVVYTNGAYDWMLSWFSARHHENKVYTEIREAGYFENSADWCYYKAKLEGGINKSESIWPGYKATVAITPAGTSPVLSATIESVP
ncbi:hypothetical protein FNV43_RR02642 [Rhamnella rubrinervis]|uniref:Uncharacterized protein n=1 Tax=Rhamnella rubrinervis TaxID=2594499 RepID=A0A8K0HTR6_9ROSA|nr:hypothetical protein FNV43_RR02642 [Rhamnella rubrinervis]